MRSSAAPVERDALDAAEIHIFETAHIDRRRFSSIRPFARGKGRAPTRSAEVMIDYVLVEQVRCVFTLA
jgi:hypothetical protein